MADLSTGFKDLDRLIDVRNEYLNPTMKIVAKMEPEVDKLVKEMPLTVNKVTFDETTNILKLNTTDPANNDQVDLSSLKTELPPVVPQSVMIQGPTGVPHKGIEIIKFEEGLTVVASHPAGGLPTATIRSPGPWAKFGDRANFYPVDTFHFTGNVDLATIEGGKLVLNIPDDQVKLKSQIGTGEVKDITKIILEGNVANSSYDGEVLKINIPEEGGGGPVDPTRFVQNFKGFFESLGDLISKVPASESINGKSYAFVKDSQLGGQYYTPYFYNNNAWDELKQDPAITYNPTSSQDNQGVFSIKPDPKITIDTNGQLDLSALGAETPQQDRWFHGYFNTIQELNAEVTRPIAFKSFAYVKAPSPSQALLSMAYIMKSDGTSSWTAISPLGTIAMVAGTSPNYVVTPLHGIRKNEAIDMDGEGVITIKPARDVVINCRILDSTGSAVEGKFDTIEFLDGHNFATVVDTKLILNHPNRCIDYSSNFENTHKEEEYLGNIFYDRKEDYWMGRGRSDPADMGGNKWSRIAYPKMAVDVKNIMRRLPQKAAEVLPGNLGDNGQWENTGWTFMVPRTPGLPDEAKETGGYIQTYVKDVNGETGIPQERIQICYTDEEHPKTFMRRFDTGNTSLSDPVWKPWYKASVSMEDITHHDTDPQAHHELLKYYKVVTFETPYTRLKTYRYRLPTSDLMLIAESTGHTDSKWNPVTMPYDGNFKFNGRLSFDRFDTTAGKYPVGDWIFKIIKDDPLTGNETIINTFSRTHNDANKTFASLMWETGTIPLKKTDKIYFDIQFSNDAEFGTLFDVGKFFVMRSYIVMQDENTTSGSLIAETFRKTLGNLNARENSGVTIHPQTVGSSSIRVYGEQVDNTFDPMTRT